MIAEALRVLLFGMLGIFLVLGVIYGLIILLTRFSGRLGSCSERSVSDVAPVVVENLPPDAELVPITVAHQPADGFARSELSNDDYRYTIKEIIEYSIREVGDNGAA